MFKNKPKSSLDKMIRLNEDLEALNQTLRRHNVRPLTRRELNKAKRMMKRNMIIGMRTRAQQQLTS